MPGTSEVGRAEGHMPSGRSPVAAPAGSADAHSMRALLMHDIIPDTAVAATLAAAGYDVVRCSGDGKFIRSFSL